MADQDTTWRDNRIKTIGIVLAVVLLLSIYPGYRMMQGYDFARHAAANGIAVNVSAKLDGFGFGAKASQAALNKEVEFNNELYEEIGSGNYLRREYGVGEGVSGFFFGLGTKLAPSS
jgi:hypothetical protein